MYSLLRKFLDEEQATLIYLMLLSIPLSYIMSRLTNKYLILALSFTASFAFQSVMFPQQKYLLWAQQQIVYLLLVCCPRRSIGKIVLFESFLFLSGVQARRMYISYAVNGIDITGILMMQIFLYVGLAFNYQRGAQPDHELSEGARARKIVNRPDYLTYMGFVFFLPSALVGPTFEYRDYEDYLNRKGDYQSIPPTWKAGCKELGVFLLTVGVYLATSVFELFYTTGAEFSQHGMAYKLLYIGGAITHIEFKYISAWSLGLVSVHLSGLSYSASSKKFDKIAITKIWGFFFNPSVKIKIECWNIPIQIALKRYIYDSVYDPNAHFKDEKARKKVQAKAQLYTIMTSALWHGLYPGYFIAFFHWMVYLRITQQIYRVRQKSAWLQSKWAAYKLDYVESVISNYALHYFGVFFHVMTWQNIQMILVATKALPFVLLYISYALVVKMKLPAKYTHLPTKQVPAAKSAPAGSSAPAGRSAPAAKQALPKAE